MATLGGNLAQRPRCWYFRAESFVCRKMGGSVSFAQDGDNGLHAIFDNHTCAATHPSTVTTALVALGARVAIAGAGGKTREVELLRFFVARPRRTCAYERQAVREHDSYRAAIPASRRVYPERATLRRWLRSRASSARPATNAPGS